MASGFLDDAARKAFKRAIESVEAASSVEVVVAFRQRSARYLHAHAIVGFIVAAMALSTMLFVDHAFSSLSIAFDPFAVGLLAAVATDQVAPLIRLLSPHRANVVRQAARATFVERGVHNTRGRTGLLVYISWLERTLVVVPDSGIPCPLDEAALNAAMRDGGAAVAAKLESLGALLGQHCPHQPDDVNELPDAIDEDA